MLEQFVVSQVFTLFIVFCRVGAGIMVLPIFGETYVPPSMRVTLAFLIALLLTPFLSKVVPALPSSTLAFALLVVSEILIGLFIGTISNILISVMHIAGMIFSFQSGMSSAVIFDVTQNAQGSVIGNFVGLLALVLLFATGLHHLMLRGLTESYVLFVPGHFPPLKDFAETIARTLSDAFIIAAQLSTPLIVVGMLFFLGAGILSRLMPTMQVFFVIIPPQLVISFFVLITTFSGLMLWYMEFYREKLMMVFGYVK